MPEPTLAERNSKFTARIYLQLPDIGREYLLDELDADDLEIHWGRNQPILAGFKLQNYNMQYTTDDSGSDYYGLFEEGSYSYYHRTRKYFKIELCSFCGNQYEYKSFPRLILKEISGLYTLDITCQDEITELLSRQMDLDTYCPEETLMPVDGNPKRFESISLTKNEYINYFTEFLINYQRAIPAVYPEYLVDYWETGEDVEEGMPVTVCNPLWAQWIISDLCQKVIDSQDEAVHKEYFNIVQQFSDFLIYCNIPVQNIEPIRVIDDIVRAIPGEWLIKPFGYNEDKLTLVIRNVVLDGEYPSYPDFNVPVSLIRGDVKPQRTDIKRINTINVMRPSIMQTTRKKVVVS